MLAVVFWIIQTSKNADTVRNAKKNREKVKGADFGHISFVNEGICVCIATVGWPERQETTVGREGEKYGGQK